MTYSACDQGTSREPSPRERLQTVQPSGCGDLKLSKNCWNKPAKLRLVTLQDAEVSIAGAYMDETYAWLVERL